MNKSLKVVLANNKKAYFDYYIEDKYEAGIVLVGTEVKSVKQAKCTSKKATSKLKTTNVSLSV